MLRKAELGILFNAPQNIIDENRDLMVVKSFNELRGGYFKTLIRGQR